MFGAERASPRISSWSVGQGTKGRENFIGAKNSPVSGPRFPSTGTKTQLQCFHDHDVCCLPGIAARGKSSAEHRPTGKTALHGKSL